MAVIADKGIAGLWEGSVGNWVTPTFREANPDIISMMQSEFMKTTPAGYSGCAIALKGLDYLKDLGEMKVPMLFVAGSEDKGATPETMQAMAAACPDSAYALVEDAGHIINVNQAEAFNLAICEFLGMCGT